MKTIFSRSTDSKGKRKQWHFGACSETGFFRKENQDRMGRASYHGGEIYVVSDGMGGHKGGSIAAEMTVQTLLDELSHQEEPTSLFDLLKHAFQYANQVVYERGHSNESVTKGMGATAVVMLTKGAKILVGHVGDSRAYLFDNNKRLHLLTKDHTRVQRMVDDGLLSEAEAENHPDASILERAIGHLPTVKSTISKWRRLRCGEQILLCSDGLSGYVSDKEIANALSICTEPSESAELLTALALKKGGEDNVTVQVIRYGDQPKIAVFKKLSAVLSIRLLSR